MIWEAAEMRILGIDPGYAIIGWGVLDYERNHFSVVDYGAITTPAGMPFPQRLENIYNDATALMDRLKPDALSIEKLYFTNNKTTGIDVAQARGVLMLAAVLRFRKSSSLKPGQVALSWGLVALFAGIVVAIEFSFDGKILRDLPVWAGYLIMAGCSCGIGWAASRLIFHKGGSRR